MFDPHGGAASAVAVCRPIGSYIRPVGDDAVSVMVGTLLQADVHASKSAGQDGASSTVGVLVEEYLGGLPECPPSHSQAAKKTGLHRQTVQTKVKSMASAVFHGSRALAASVVSKVLRAQHDDDLKFIYCFQNVLYDETPLTLRGKKLDAAAPTKLFQSEVEVAVLTQSKANPRSFSCCVLALPQPVQSLKKGTGMILKTALNRACRVPFWRELEQSNKDVFAAGISCCDRAGSNGVAEDQVYAATADVARLRMPCYARIAATSQGRGFSAVAEMFTGIIAGSLTMAKAGEADDFGECIQQALLDGLDLGGVLDAQPLPADSPAVRYLDDLLRLTLPGTDSGFARAQALRDLLTSDVREVSIWLRVPGGVLDRKSWAKQVAENLLPTAIAVFPRHRWVNSADAVGAYALLGGVHDVLPRAGQLWMGERSKSGVRTLCLVDDKWAVSDDEDAPKKKQDSVAVAVGGTAQAASETAPTNLDRVQQNSTK